MASRRKTIKTSQKVGCPKCHGFSVYQDSDATFEVFRPYCAMCQRNGYIVLKKPKKKIIDLRLK